MKAKTFFKETICLLKLKFLFLFALFILISQMGFTSNQYIEIEEGNKKALKFKIGFEFQEVSGLCPWSLENYNIQKKPIFLITDNFYKELVELVIDTNDIEFVTKPFSSDEELLHLENGIKSVQIACKTLQRLEELKKDKISFQEWIYGSNILDKGLSEVLKLEGLHVWPYTKIFNSVKDGILSTPSFWHPKFSPQITIQHPLECSIPLYFSLFGFDSNPSDMFHFSASIPLRDAFIQCYEKTDHKNFGKLIQGYENKVNGLVFLHALTLVQMTPNEDHTDKNFLEETEKALTTSHQVDAKMKLNIMSRRPFSSMLQDIHVPGEYDKYFAGVMSKNDRFMKFFKVPDLFYKINYGEQFFDNETGKIKSLLDIIPLFKENFFKENETVIYNLLSKGVVTTTMLRNFKEEYISPDIFKYYFRDSITTVQSPKKRHIIDTNSLDSLIKEVPYEYDILSPPHFLSFEDSMGRFKKEMTEEEKKYGEAIVEVRGVKSVQPWFLKECKLSPDRTGAFLTTPEDILTEALALFGFLKNFGTFDHKLAIYYMGIPTALKKY